MQWIHEAAEFVAVKLWCVDEMFSQQQTGRAGGSSTMDQKIKRSWDLGPGIQNPEIQNEGRFFIPLIPHSRLDARGVW